MGGHILRRTTLVKMRGVLVSTACGLSTGGKVGAYTRVYTLVEKVLPRGAKPRVTREGRLFPEDGQKIKVNMLEKKEIGLCGVKTRNSAGY
jgi:hypothetical protein